MKTLKITAAALVLAGFASAAQAQDSNTYGAIGVAAYEFDAYGIEGKLGYNFNEYFGVEGQGAFGVISDKETIGGIETKTKIDYNLGAFGVVRAPLGDNIEVFARGGYHTTGASVEAAGIKVDGDYDGLAAGAGMTYWLADGQSGLRGEYTWLDGDGGGLDTVSVSYVRKF